MRVPAPLLLLALVAAAALAPSAAQAQEPSEEWMLHILGFQYFPDPLEVPAGATVTVMNFEQPGPDAQHTVTSSAQPPLFDVVQIEPGGAPYPFTAPSEPGEYPYYCRYHGDREGNGMAGTLIVVVVAEPQPVSEPAPTSQPTRETTPAPTGDEQPQQSETPFLEVALLTVVVGAAAWLRRSR